MSTSSSSDLIQLRMKLLDSKVFVSGVNSGTKSVKGLGRATTETATKQRYAERTTSRLTSSYKQLGSAAKWGLGFLGVGGVLAIESSIHASEELGKTTSALTRNFGLQNNVASRWGAVAQAREIDSKALSMTFGTLSTKMVEAGRKGGTLLTPFHQLGISQEEATKGAHDFEWGLLRVAKALGEEEGSARRSAAAKALLGKSGAALLPLFSEGTKGLQEQLHWADKYGVTLSGSTTNGLMEMVQAQRENKVAMLGLQLSLTKALMPAIHAGDDQLHEFIATLNSPHLTAEQKISRISHQFLLLEDDLVHIIEQALPHIAEQGGHLGVALAGAVWHGFIHSDTLGKLVIGAWLFKSMGGLSLVGTLGARVGGKLATSLGWKFLETVAPYFAAETGVEGLGAAMASRMPALTAAFSGFGATLGAAMGVAIVTFGAAYVATHQEDILEAIGADTNHGMLTGTTREMEALKLREAGYKIMPFGANGNVIDAITPGGSHERFLHRGNRWVPANAHGKPWHWEAPEGAGTKIVSPKAGHVPRSHSSKRLQTEALRIAPRASGGNRVTHVHVHLKGREIAEAVTTEALDGAALQ